MSDTVVRWSDRESREIIPGFHGRFAHSARMTLADWVIEEGAVLPEHAHEHEQVVNVIEGRLEVTVEGRTTVLEGGMVGIVPPNARHSGRALTRCRVLDVFAPVREDYKAGSAGGVLQQAMGSRS